MRVHRRYSRLLGGASAAHARAGVPARPWSGGNLGTSLSGVSCTSARLRSDRLLPEQLRLLGFCREVDGATWAVQTTPSPAGAGVILEGVSCVRAGACEAVGSDQRGSVSVALAEKWNGTNWAIQTIPAPQGCDCALQAGCREIELRRHGGGGCRPARLPPGGVVPADAPGPGTTPGWPTKGDRTWPTTVSGGSITATRPSPNS